MMVRRWLISRLPKSGGIRAHSHGSSAKGVPMIRKVGSLLALAGAAAFACWNLASAQTPMAPCLAVNASPPATCGTTTTGGAPLFLGNSMQGITLQSGGTGWTRFVGTDQKYGTTLPRAPASPWGGTAGYTDSIQQIFNSGTSGPCTAGSGAGCDITEAIGTDSTVPSGVSTSVLITKLVNAYSGVPQDAYIIEPSTSAPQGMLYTSRWVWLQADMPSRGAVDQEVSEFKTPDGNSTQLGPERFQMNILQQSWTGYGATTPVFNFAHNTAYGYPGGGFYNYTAAYVSPNTTQASSGTGVTHYCPVPLGRWFKIEFAFNRSDSQGQGWMWAAITDPASPDPAIQAGVQIYAARGAFSFTDPSTKQTWTNGLNPGPASSGYAAASPVINRIFLHNLSYGTITRSAANPYVIKMTDMQVYTGWPASASAHPSNYN